MSGAARRRLLLGLCGTVLAAALPARARISYVGVMRPAAAYKLRPADVPRLRALFKAAGRRFGFAYSEFQAPDYQDGGKLERGSLDQTLTLPTGAEIRLWTILGSESSGIDLDSGRDGSPWAATLTGWRSILLYLRDRGFASEYPDVAWCEPRAVFDLRTAEEVEAFRKAVRALARAGKAAVTETNEQGRLTQDVRWADGVRVSAYTQTDVIDCRVWLFDATFCTTSPAAGRQWRAFLRGLAAGGFRPAAAMQAPQTSV